jgi:regulatory protein
VNEKVYEKAIKLLSIRLHTTGELQRKLKTKGFEEADILEVLRRLEELDFLNDERFAQIYIDNLKRFKDFGHYGIKAKLLTRHIPSSMAEAALKEFFTPEDELIVAKRLIKKISRRVSGSALGGKKTYEQKARALSTRGFRSEILRQVLKSNSD